MTAFVAEEEETAARPPVTWEGGRVSIFKVLLLLSRQLFLPLFLPLPISF